MTIPSARVPPRGRPHALCLVIILMVTGGGLMVTEGGCIQSRQAPDSTITVEGRVTARGNEPFSAWVLETEEHNLYVLDLADSLRGDLPAPAELRVTGRLYRGEWEGRPFAHLEVQEWEMVEPSTGITDPSRP